MVHVFQKGDIYELKFSYDEKLINIVKGIPGRQYLPASKSWIIPTTSLGMLLKAVKATPYEHSMTIYSNEALGEDDTLDSTNEIPDIDISDVTRYVKEGHSLYSHQIDFLKYAKNKGNKGFILADDMGCISGDAKIILYASSNYETYSLERLYKLFHTYKHKTEYRVKCCNTETNKFTYETIIDVLDSGIKQTYRLHLENFSHVDATSDHEIYTDKGFVPLCKLHVGDMVAVNGKTGTRRCRYVKITNITNVGEQHTYDIKLAGPYHNFIANGIVVHNCGKTLEIINYGLYQKKRYDYKHCLIIACVNSAKYSWQEDIHKHTNGEQVGYILGTRLKRNGHPKVSNSGEDKVIDLKSRYMYGKTSDELPYYLIMNIESIRTKIGRKYALADAIINMANAGEINMIVIDECHKNLSPSSAQGKLIKQIYEYTKGKVQWIPMTGTPIKNRPTDVYLPLKLIDGHQYSNYYNWQQLFCVFGGYGDHEIIGYKNIPELKKLLQNNMIRRMKSEVLDLPPKIYHTEYIENTPYQNKLYNQIIKEIIASKEDILDSMNPLAAMLILRQINGSPELVDEDLEVDNTYINKNAKLKHLLDLLEDIDARGEKVVVFSNWVEPLRMIYKFISKKYKTCCYTGTMSTADREKYKNAFINDPECKVMLGTIGAMGVSLTLTVATNVIFYDDCWCPADKIQAEDRCVRIGTTSSVNIYTLISKDTIDERVNQILEDKKAIANFIVDDKLDIRNNPELFDFLLGN